MKSKKVSLYLIPTPIDENSLLADDALQLMLKAATEQRESSLFVIEDLKPGRRRWLRYGLPRDCVEDFVLFNEQTQTELIAQLIDEMKNKKQVFLMSDGGLPTFCDPGIELVRAVHAAGLRVSMTSFANSMLAALVLSGFDSSSFFFQGFLPKKSDERQLSLDKVAQFKGVQVLMETPYRLTRILEEFAEHSLLKERELCLALDLNTQQEQVLLGKAPLLLRELSGQKREFVLVINSIYSKG